MVLRWCILIALVTLVALFEQTTLTAWPSPLNLLPLSFLIGILVMQFVSNGFGVLWLILAGIDLDYFGLAEAPQALSYAWAAIAVWILAQRVFTNRSVYAMMGMGATGYLIVTGIQMLWLSFHGAGGVYLASLPSEWAIYLAALFVSFFASRRLSAFIRAIFLVRSL